MDIYRVRESEKKYIEYKESYIHNTALIAFHEHEPYGIFEYKIVSLNKAKVINFEVFKECNKDKIFNDFINELSYWNPYIKFIEYNGQTQEIKEVEEIFTISLDEITIGQLTIDREKYERVLKWARSPEDIIISCIKVGEKIICIDGYTRLVAAYKNGFQYVYGYYEEVEDTKFYETCLKWCEEDNIVSIKDLMNRIVSPQEHKNLWIDRCNEYFKNNK